MLAVLVSVAALAPYSQPPSLKAVGGLAGCWKALGQVRGKDATSVARGSWHLGGRYFVLQLKSVTPGRPYEAAISYGAGEKPNEIGSFWADTFGGLYQPSLGLGRTTVDGFLQEYRFTDALYVNRFKRTATGWTWTIVEQAAGKPDKLFARYDLNRTGCGRIRFDF